MVAHGAVLNQLTIRGNILQVADEHELEEDNWVNRGIAYRAKTGFGMLIKESQIKRFLQPTVEVIFRNAAGKLETGDEFFVIAFSALHG